MKSRIILFLKKFKIVHFLYRKYKNFKYKKEYKDYKLLKNRESGIIQVVSTFSKYDAIGNCVLEISKGLTNKNIKNYIVSDVIKNKVENIYPIDLFKFKEDDIVILHMGDYSYCGEQYIKLKCKTKILYYHNITPDYFFINNPSSRKSSILARELLFRMVDVTNSTITVSRYNDLELEKLGFKNRHVIAIPNRVDELLKYKVNRENNNITNFITVGRIERNKCIHDVIDCFDAYYNKYNNNSCLYIIGKPTNPVYLKELKNKVLLLNSKNNIKFVETVTEETLAYYYSNADAYLCMSEHEGFCVPLVEAMAFGVPIFAYDSSAIKETLCGSGVLFNNKDHFNNALFINDKLKNDTKELIRLENDVVKKYYNTQNLIDDIIDILVKN